MAILGQVQDDCIREGNYVVREGRVQADRGVFGLNYEIEVRKDIKVVILRTAIGIGAVCITVVRKGDDNVLQDDERINVGTIWGTE